LQKKKNPGTSQPQLVTEDILLSFTIQFRIVYHPASYLNIQS